MSEKLLYCIVIICLLLFLYYYTKTENLQNANLVPDKNPYERFPHSDFVMPVIVMTGQMPDPYCPKKWWRQF